MRFNNSGFSFTSSETWYRLPCRIASKIAYPFINKSKYNLGNENGEIRVCSVGGSIPTCLIFYHFVLKRLKIMSKLKSKGKKEKSIQINQVEEDSLSATSSQDENFLEELRGKL